MGNIGKRAALNGRGWIKIDPADIVNPGHNAAAASQLRKLFENLPVDPYCGPKTRCRRFIEFEVDPVLKAVEPLPAKADPDTGEMFVEYFQNKQVNPDDGGLGRRFPALDLSPCNTVFLKEIIWNCYELTEWPPETRDVKKVAGFHTVSYQPGETHQAVASPNVFHQDGEPYTFGILVERLGVNGGENYIGTLDTANKRLDEIPGTDILDTFTLENAFEGFGVCDRIITHYVAPLTRKAPGEKGYRNIILLDFTPIP